MTDEDDLLAKLPPQDLIFRLPPTAGKVVHITPDNVALTHDQIGSDIAGWVNYQPLYDQITREQPDLFD